MPERRKDIRDVLSDTARRKRRVAEVRFGGAPTSGEVPRDVYVAACQAIATPLGADGYTYAKSGPKLSRKSQDSASAFRSNRVITTLPASWLFFGFMPT